MRNDARRPDELITASGIAALLGVTPSAVSNWQTRTETGTLDTPFPQPWFQYPARNPKKVAGLFVRSEVEEWYADRRAIAVERNARNIARLEAQLAAARAKTATTVAGPNPVLSREDESCSPIHP